MSNNVLNQELCDKQGRRKYFTSDERDAFLEASSKAAREVRPFCNVLLFTGCRVSEALALTTKNIDLSAKVIVFESLKKRRSGVFRQVPIPAELLDLLDMVHGIREIQKKGRAGQSERLWSWCRMTAWRKVEAVIKDAGIVDGPLPVRRDCVRFGIAAVSKGVALNMLQEWLGHSQMTTTAIYANATGVEERNIAARMWA